MEETHGACQLAFRELLATDLRLDPRQWGPAPRRHAMSAGGRIGEASTSGVAPGGRDEAVLEIDCLVHDDWIKGAATGALPPPLKLPVAAEEMHWLLQTSCDCPTPSHWQRVSILCLRKASESDVPDSRMTKRFLIPQEKGYSKTSIHELLTQISQENQLASWQEVLSSLHPTPTTGPARPSNSYVREVIDKLYHTEVIQLEPIPTQRRKQQSMAAHERAFHSTVPTSRPTQKDQTKQVTITANTAVVGGGNGTQQTHSNLSPLLLALESHSAFYLVFPYCRFTLLDIALHSPAMFNDSVAKPMFVFYQLLKVLEHCHEVGVTLGPLSLRSVFVDSRLWLQVRLPGHTLHLVGPEMTGAGGEDTPGEIREGGDLKVRGRERKRTRSWRERHVRKTVGDTFSTSTSASTVTVSDGECEMEGSESAKDTSSESSPVKQPSHLDPISLSTVPEPPAIPLSEAVQLWQHGSLDNLTYLLLLNRHTGRRLGDANNHPIVPWVSDFTHPTRGFRDFTKTKFRMNKGDNQLNFTFNTAREDAQRREGGILDGDSSPTPHHVGDTLTDVTYYVYKARQTPREVLCTHVRPRWVPEEYPASMEKMYVWTPDECIPEFYTDPHIFRSIHPDLPDLAIPTWCDSPEEFVTSHRQLLESDHVSSQLHHWIDLMFGYKLSGEAAVRAKNVYVSLVDKHKNPKNHGIVQLFRTSHPKRVQGSCASTALLEWETYLGQSQVSDGASFPIDRQETINRFTRGTLTRAVPSNRPHIRTLESIVRQQVRRLGPDEDTGEVEEIDEGAGHLEEAPPFDSSFEQIPFPDDLFLSSGHSSFPNISYGDSPLDVALSGPAYYSAYGKPTLSGRTREGAVLNSTQTHLGGGQNRFRMARYFRQRRANQSEGSGDEFQWQGAEIGLPRDCQVMQGLVEQEERAHFVARSCKDFANYLSPLWDQKHLEEMATTSEPSSVPPLLALLEKLESNPLFIPSLAERVMVDMASAVATVVELCCIRELRVATRVNASLRERVEAIRRIFSSGQLRLPSYLRTLVELVLSPDTERASSLHLSLPRLSPSLLLQPFLPVVSFPGYFDHLHRFASALELTCRHAGLDHHHDPSLQQLLVPPKHSSLFARSESDPGTVSRVLESVSENLTSLVASTAHGEGFVLLLLHLYPLFQYPQTSFEMAQTHLDTLGRYMSHAQVSRLFMSVFVHFFDGPLQPHQQGLLFSRSTADLLVRRFGLHSFLAKFLEFFLNAVLEPDKLSVSGGAGSVRRNVFRLKESESVLTILPPGSEAPAEGASVGEQPQLASAKYEEKRQSHMSDFTFSVDLSEVGGRGYHSERESSSEGDSEDELHPESSLLARTSVVASSVGPVMSDIITEENEGGEESDGKTVGRGGGGEASVQMMLLPQLSLGGQSNLDPTPTRERRSSSLMSEPKTDVRAAEGDRDSAVDGDISTHSTAQHTDHSSSLLATSVDITADSSETTNTVAVMNGDVTGLEDSLPIFSSNSASDPFSSKSATVRTDSGASTKTTGERESGEAGEGVGRWAGGGWDEHEAAREEEEEEEMKKKKESESMSDPEVAAINQRIAEVAGDCLSWLMWRIGPLLATRHIVNPLLNGLHRCFTGIVGRGHQHGAVMRCLAYAGELYGERVLTKLYLPRVEGWVASATNRMSVKAESNVAASLALVRLVTRQLSAQRLEDITTPLCEMFFIPLIQLLSSQTIFPSGGEARATICHSLVLLLLKTGWRLGRDKSLHLLLETLRLFFTCFDGVYAAQLEDTDSRGRAESDMVSSSSSATHFSSQVSAPGKLGGAAASERERSVTGVVDGTRGPDNRKANWASTKRKVISLEGEGTSGGPHQTKDSALERRQGRKQPLTVSLSTHNLALEQLHQTFSPAMAHAAYIPFCMLLGQISLNTELRNTELIEHIAYGYDNHAGQENRVLPSIFLPSEDEGSSSSNSDSEDSTTADTTRPAEEELERDVTIKLGPVEALQQRRGLGRDAVSFGRTTWFVDLNQDAGGGEMGGASSSAAVAVSDTGGVTERGNETLTATVTGVGGVGITSGGGSAVEAGMTRSVAVMGDEGGGGGGRGWMEGVRGSAVATAASGILNLIQNRQATEMPQARGSKVNDLTRHSINFDMKFQSVTGAQNPGSSTDMSSTDDVECHLTGHWGELWESQLHQSPHNVENYTHFMGKKLQVYTGHKASVRSLAVSDSEHFFLSASKDKTIKLWLLRNQGGGSAQISAHLTYTQHQKPVSTVELVSTTGDVLSCDGTVHLWDPEFGHSIHQYASPRGREFIAMTTLLPPQQVAIVVTADSALRFIDFRTHTLQHTWKLHPSIGGIQRCLACGDNWVAVGNSGGVVSSLDIRMGALLHQWRPSDFNLVTTTTWSENLFQLCSTRHGNLVTSVGAGTMHLWRPSTGKLLSHIRGQSSTTPCLDTIGEQLISASSNGQVVIHNIFERTKDPLSAYHWGTKVRSKELKGGVASLATLQENRLLLLGSDNGQVVLMS